MQEKYINYSKKGLNLGLLISVIFIILGIVIFFIILNKILFYFNAVKQGEIPHYMSLTIYGIIQWFIGFIGSVGAVIFFPMVIIRIIRRLKDSRPYMIINEQGIINNPNSKKPRMIPWNDINNIELVRKKVVISLEKGLLVIS